MRRKHNKKVIGLNFIHSSFKYIILCVQRICIISRMKEHDKIYLTYPEIFQALIKF